MHLPIRSYRWLAVGAAMVGVVACGPQVEKSRAFKDLVVRVSEMDEASKKLARDVASNRAELAKLNEEFQPVSADVAQLMKSGPAGAPGAAGSADAVKALEARVARLEAALQQLDKGKHLTLQPADPAQQQAAEAQQSADATAEAAPPDAAAAKTLTPATKTGKADKVVAKAESEPATTDESATEGKPESDAENKESASEAPAQEAAKTVAAATDEGKTATGKAAKTGKVRLRKGTRKHAAAASTAAAGAAGEKAEPAATARQTGVYHEVKKGETLESIAQQYHVTGQKILTANGLSASVKLFVGQQIYVPKP